MGAFTLAHAIIILIHGTWANESPWYLPDNFFFKCLSAHVKKQDAMVVPFCWSGNLNHASRVTAGKVLVQLIKSYPKNVPIVIIAHSHGGNVALSAAQELGKEKSIERTIDKLYLLGTPAAPIYWPNMDVIGKLYNIISFADLIQPVGGLFSRMQPWHINIANIRLLINDEEPGHSELPSYYFSYWFPEIDAQIHYKKEDSFADFRYQEPGILYLYRGGRSPEYALDSEWFARLEQDQFMMPFCYRSLLQDNSYVASHEA